MGYRSDVALCLTAEAEQTLRSRLNKVQKTHSSGDVTALREFITSPQTFKEENGVTLRYWSWCKWYLEAPVISFMDNFMANLEYSSYLFYRIGDELDDIERDGGFYENPFELNVSVTIDFNSNN